MIDAIVLAGAVNKGKLRVCSEAEYEAMIYIGKKMLVEYVVDAMIKVDKIKRVLIVGPRILRDVFNSMDILVVDAKGSLLDNVCAALDSLNLYSAKKGSILIVTSDIPFVTPGVIEKFIDEAVKQEADIVFPIISKDIMERAFPQAVRTYVKLKEGVFTGGNMILAKNEGIYCCAEKGKRFVEWRKSPFKLCSLLGTRFLYKYLMSKLTIPEIEHKISEILDIKSKALVCDCPEIGMDIDKPEDFLLAEKLLAQVS